MRAHAGGTVFFLIMIFLPVTMSGQQSTTYGVPKDEKKTYSLTVGEFTGISLSVENQYLTTSVPRLIMEGLQDIPFHTLAENELSNYRNSLLFKARTKAGEEIAALLKADAELLFTEQDPEKYATARAENAKKIEERRAYLEYLEGIDPMTIPVAEEKPLTILRGKDNLLTDGSETPSEYGISDTARKTGSDLLITGTVEEIQGYLYFQIGLWSALAETSLLNLQDAVTPDAVSSLIENLMTEITAVVLGRDWVTVRIIPEPGDAYVYIDDVLIGTGETVAGYLKTGPHTLLIEKNGYYPEKREIDIQGEEPESISIKLMPIPKSVVSVLTDPPGAQVYIGAEWKGVTPLSIEIPAKTERVLIRMPGYADIQQIVTPSDSYTLNLTLRPIDATAPVFKDYKNAFYTAFGMFSLSLPFTVGIFGLSQTFRAAADLTTNLATNTYMKYAADVYQYAYWGCLALTGSLFINTIYRLFEYIKAGEDTF